MTGHDSLARSHAHKRIPNPQARPGSFLVHQEPVRKSTEIDEMTTDGPTTTTTTTTTAREGQVGTNLPKPASFSIGEGRKMLSYKVAFRSHPLAFFRRQYENATRKSVPPSLLL
jgi:hypothetical protein